MRNLLNLILITAVLLTLVAGCAEPTVNTGIFADEGELKNEIKNKVGAFPANWEQLEFTNVSNNSISIWITYSEKPDLDVLENDTKRVAQDVLDVLQAKGYDRKKNGLYLSVRGNLHYPNSDRRPHPIGETVYNRNNDNIYFSKDWFGY